MKKIVIACWAAFCCAVSLGAAVKGSCESKADDISMSVSGAIRTVTLVPAYDEDEGTSDPEVGVFYFKATLKRGNGYSAWTTVPGTNEVALSSYPAEPSESSEKDTPDADFTEIEELGLNQRIVMYASDWTVGSEDPEDDDPSSWSYYFVVEGQVGDKVTVNFQQGVVIPLGREENPRTLSPSLQGGEARGNLQVENEYYFRARLVAGRMYRFSTTGGGEDLYFDLDVDPEETEDDEAEPEEALVGVYADPDYEGSSDAGVYVVPFTTGYYQIVLSGSDPTVEEGVETEELGAAFGLNYRLAAQRPIGEHAFVDLTAENGFAAELVAGSCNAWNNLTNSVYDDIIDESLVRFSVVKGARYSLETTGAATNLLMRVYDATGKMVGENAGDGRSDNVRAAFTASATGFMYAGVCQNLSNEFDFVAADTTVRVALASADAVDGTPDEWDCADDVAATASDLVPVLGPAGKMPEAVDVDGHGWHQLGRTDWCDVFRIAGRKNVTYALRVTREPGEVVNHLAAEVFTLSGTSERVVATTGDINAESDEPLTFTATAHAIYYIRLSVAEGQGLDCSSYKVHARASSATGEALYAITVNTYGTTRGTFSLGSETIKYPGGGTVLVSGPQTVKFGAVAGFSTPLPVSVPVQVGPDATVVDVYYSDTADPKDNTAKTATAWTVKNVETAFDRTLWTDDPEDNFTLTGKDGYYFDLALRNLSCGAVFSITNALLGTIVENVQNVRQLTLPTSTAKYILTVTHTPEDKTGGSYTLAGLFANVGAIKFAKTAVTAKENAPSVAITVNRTAKDGMVRVNYRTMDGTAQAGADYVAQSGVLEWANNDNKAKTITVKLIPDLVAVYEGNKTFSVILEPAEGSEYPASILGGDTCMVTLTEVSRVGTTVASTYAAKAPKRATTMTEKVALDTGTFYGVLSPEPDALTNGLPQLASLTLTASTARPAAALSAKVALAGKTYTFAAKGWDDESETAATKVFTLVQKVANVTYTNTLTVVLANGTTTNGVDWLQAGGSAELVMNVPDANAKGVQSNIVYTGALYRNNAKIQDYLDVITNFTGYYTVALASGATVADGVPAGTGYLTLTVDNKGTVKVAGALADGVTKPSLSVPACAVKPDAASANGYALHIPLFFVKAPQVLGGELRLVSVPAENLPSGATAQIVVDAASPLVWNNDNASATYDGTSGFRFAPVPCGGWYDTVFNLQTYYLDSALSVGTAGVLEFPSEALPAGYQYATAAEPNGFALAFTGDTLTYDKKVLVKRGALVDLDASTNVCNVAVKLVRATGLYSGTCSLWSENAAGTAQKEITGLKHAGVLVLSRDAAAPLPPNVLGAGFVTQAVKVPSVNPVTKAPTTRAWTFSVPFNILCD